MLEEVRPKACEFDSDLERMRSDVLEFLPRARLEAQAELLRLSRLDDDGAVVEAEEFRNEVALVIAEFANSRVGESNKEEEALNKTASEVISRLRVAVDT